MLGRWTHLNHTVSRVLQADALRDGLLGSGALAVMQVVDLQQQDARTSYVCTVLRDCCCCCCPLAFSASSS